MPQNGAALWIYVDKEAITLPSFVFLSSTPATLAAYVLRTLACRSHCYARSMYFREFRLHGMDKAFRATVARPDLPHLSVGVEKREHYDRIRSCAWYQSRRRQSLQDRAGCRFPG